MAPSTLKRKVDTEEDSETFLPPNPKRPAVDSAQTMDVEAGIISHQQYLLIPQRTRFNSTSSWSTTSADSSHSPTPSLSSLPSSPAGILGHEAPFYSSAGSIPFPADSSMMDLDMPHSVPAPSPPQPLPSGDAPAIAFSASALFLPMPQKSGFTHLRDTCTQIPKLRVSNHAGLTGERTLWSVCEQCGATEMFRGCGGASVGWGYD